MSTTPKKNEDSEAIERLDLASMDIAAAKRAELSRLFPEAVTEGGKVDLDRLKLALGESIDVGKERYGMVWPGKADCFKTIQQPSLATLRPVRDESVNFDTTENLIIEGDNLEVLKLLQKSYLGAVKMIYIDPPYNTGNEFIYPDNFSESLQTYLEYTGQVGSDGKKFSTNSETDGRFHSKWLNMMYPRLYLARNLLRADGVVFISIDEHELNGLRFLCDEVFGEENRVGIICWKNVTDNNPTLITPDNEFVLCYARSIDSQPKYWTSYFSSAKDLLQGEYERLKAQGFPSAIIQEKIREFISDNEESVGFLSRYKFVDADGVYTGSESVHNPRPGGYDFEVPHPKTGKAMRKPANGYRFPEKTFREMEASGVILYGEDENRIVKIKKYVKDYEDSLRSVITLDGRLGSYELKRLFPDAKQALFTNPKPTALIESLVSFVTDRDSIVLDFFAGSGSTAHAVMELNERDKGDRKFIVVQLPEPLDLTDGNQKAAAEFCASLDKPQNIAELMKERIRRVVNGKVGAAPQGASLFAEQLSVKGVGFRVYKLAESNFLPWNGKLGTDGKALEKQLELHINHVVPGRSSEDLLYEILLKSGFPLTTPIEILGLEDKSVYSISGGSMLICLEREITLEAIRAMAERKPERVVCLDEGFAGNDQLKTNAVQTMKTKGVKTFRTV